MTTEVAHHSIHIPKWKKDEIEDIKNLITTHSSVGIVGVHGIPSNQLQVMRKNLRGLADIKDRKSTRLNSSHNSESRMPSSA
jgi:large subunit ribosomal protein L10